MTSSCLSVCLSVGTTITPQRVDQFHSNLAFIPWVKGWSRFFLAFFIMRIWVAQSKSLVKQIKNQIRSRSFQGSISRSNIKISKISCSIQRCSLLETTRIIAMMCHIFSATSLSSLLQRVCYTSFRCCCKVNSQDKSMVYFIPTSRSPSTASSWLLSLLIKIFAIFSWYQAINANKQ